MKELSAMDVVARNRLAFTLGRNVLLITLAVTFFFALIQLLLDMKIEKSKLTGDVGRVATRAAQLATEAISQNHQSAAQISAKLLFEYGDNVVQGVTISDISGEALVDEQRELSPKPLRGMASLLVGGSKEMIVPLVNGGGTQVGSMRIRFDRYPAFRGGIDRLAQRLIPDMLRAVALGTMIFLAFFWGLIVPVKTMAARLGTVDYATPAASRFDPPEGHDDDEFGELARGSNHMLARFEESLQKRRATEAKVHEREAFIYGVINNVPDTILTINADGQVETCNPAAVALFGHSPDHLIGLSVDRLFGEPTRSRFLQSFNRYRKSNDPRYLEGMSGDCAVSIHDGSTSPVQLQVHEMRILERRVIVMIIRDLADKLRAEQQHSELEEQIMGAQKLAGLGKLLAGVSHDFNNILVGILGNADLALSDMTSMTPARSIVEDIRRSAITGSELTSQMMAYSGGAEAKKEALFMNDFLTQMTPLLRSLVSEHVELKFDYTENIPAIEADATLFRQLVVNLIGNSVDAIGDKPGVIHVRTGINRTDSRYMQTMDINCELSEGYYVYIEVADTGCGFDEEARGKLFAPFFTSKPNARGLGLAAVHGIVRSHNAAVRVQSEPGRGAAFKIFFPYTDSKPKPAAPREEPGVPENWRGKGTILIVDDDMAVRKVTGLMLTKRGYRILTANDGKAGVEMFEKHRDEIAMIILDLVMPKMNGEQALNEIQRIDPSASVVLCSGYNEHEAPEINRLKQRVSFLQKPFEMEELLAAVYRATESDGSDA
ncbi:MAG: PAS domain S-box-containing protein [Rhodothermales bacterium]